MSLVSRGHTFKDWNLLGNQREMKGPESLVREPGLHPITQWANTPHFRSTGWLVENRNFWALLQTVGFPRWLSSKESAYQCRRCRFNPQFWMIPCRRDWQPAPVFLSKEFHGQRSLAGDSPWGCKESDATEHTHTHQVSLRDSVGPLLGWKSVWSSHEALAWDSPQGMKILGLLVVLICDILKL